MRNYFAQWNFCSVFKKYYLFYFLSKDFKTTTQLFCAVKKEF
ncbi:hypothetical protein NU08_0376 [Flavobacterium anhuiense]|uniref:Uncharacterized protein n=1 Tax=Flavobacterium anhuiense TaxID=459526 RepID=A0A444W4Y6_9FLAO|nr:hypothetical protein NU08_0376 [Flavobacterium anhuiense]